MTKTATRFVALGVLVAILVFAPGERLGDAVRPAAAQSTETFLAPEPPKVYSEIPSHVPLIVPGDPGNSGTVDEPADADPTLGLNGYCIDVQGEDTRGSGPNLGFVVENGDPNAPDGIGIVDTDYFDNGSATTTDDVYCVVAQAERITDVLPRPDMLIRWNYISDGVSAVTDPLEIEVVTVEIIRQVNGFTGIPATVCTEGWDPEFLTGFTANEPFTTVDAPDEMDIDDWSTNPADPPFREEPRRESGDSAEWCINLVSNSAMDDVEVSLTFWALYNLGLDVDDVLITETTDEDNLVDFVAIDAPEIRHITALTPGGEGGQVDNRRAANPNVIGATHTACVLPSVPSDQLSPGGIQFASQGEATATGVFVFTASESTVPGVTPGTQCFSWTSIGAGAQEVWVNMTLSPANPLPATGPTFVSWDTNLDGNDELGPGSGLLKLWNTIDYTVINTGGNPFVTEDNLTNTSITLPVAYNVADGTYFAEIGLTEWVIGSRPGPGGSDGEPIDGVPVLLEIVSACGYFVDPAADPNLPPDTTRTSLEGVTLAGRIDFDITTFRDPACTQTSRIELEVRAAYPDVIDPAPEVEVERLSIQLSFVAPESSPIVVWAGTVVTLNYGFGGSSCEEMPVIWLRESGVGTFLADGVEDAPDMARSTLVECESTIQFASEQPGEVVIEAMIEGNPRSKVIFPIFFLAFEDLTLSVGNTDPTVSEFVSVSAELRGWFVGDNPSGREAETTEDGRQLPQDRWVLPDDWPILKGPDDFRPGWPGSISLPDAPVTFFMQREATRNSYPGNVFNGAAGYFVIDENTFFHNISPTTQVPSVLGTPSRPRIISTTITGGTGSVDVFGDFNLSFEECAENPATGNPHCEVGDIAGRTTFHAIVDYPVDDLHLQHRGKFPPIGSNTGTMNFHWAGYKRVTWEHGPTPNIRYVVAHLKDRDGFCNAVNYNNTLGVTIEFAIDSADGIITTAADRPFTINIGGSGKFATATTFDTHDDHGQPMNAEIVKVVQEDDECQAWIRIDNSLGNPVNVHVTFPPPPEPIPGDIRITAINCVAEFSFVEITNFGSNEVSLAGFALRSGSGGGLDDDGFIEEEHLGLEGHLKPGEKIVISGDSTLRPWVGVDGYALLGGEDYARIVWEEQMIDYHGCNGAHIHPENVQLHSDAEGAIMLDIIVPFNDQEQLLMSPGWNLVPIMSGDISLDDAIAMDPGAVSAVYTYDDEFDGWLRYVPGLPDQAVTITDLEQGRVYWVLAKRAFTLVVPR